MLNPEIAADRRPIDRLSRSARIGALAARVQPVVAKVLAPITDVPIGAWTVTALLDAIEPWEAPTEPQTRIKTR